MFSISVLGADDDPCQVEVEEGTDYPGLDLNLATGRTTDRKNSPAECQALCTANPKCNFFGWKAKSKECWMKTGISRRVPQEGTISGPACRINPLDIFFQTYGIGAGNGGRDKFSP